MTDKEVFAHPIYKQSDKLNTAELLLIDIYKQQCDKDGKECDIKGFSEWIYRKIQESEVNQ